MDMMQYAINILMFDSIRYDISCTHYEFVHRNALSHFTYCGFDCRPCFSAL